MNPLFINIEQSRTQSILRMCVVGLVLVLLNACEYSYTQFTEPAVKGKIIDFETRLPIQGAAVYGYYALGKGSLAGGYRETETIRSFEVVSDNQGEFEIPAWKSKKTIWEGEPRGNFPMIAVYKSGYEHQYDSISTIRRWVPTVHNEGDSIRSEELIDWRQRPIPLKKVKNVSEHFRELSASSYTFRMVGECAWEKHKALLWMRHLDLKMFKEIYLYREKGQREYLHANGYMHNGRYISEPPPAVTSLGKWAQEFSGARNPTEVENIFKRFNESKGKWKCTHPSNIFK